MFTKYESHLNFIIRASSLQTSKSCHTFRLNGAHKWKIYSGENLTHAKKWLLCNHLKTLKFCQFNIAKHPWFSSLTPSELFKHFLFTFWPGMGWRGGREQRFSANLTSSLVQGPRIPCCAKSVIPGYPGEPGSALGLQAHFTAHSCIQGCIQQWPGSYVCWESNAGRVHAYTLCIQMPCLPDAYCLLAFGIERPLSSVSQYSFLSLLFLYYYNPIGFLRQFLLIISLYEILILLVFAYRCYSSW